MATGDPCTRGECARPQIARGLCRTCYNTAHRRGDFAEPVRRRRSSGFVCPPTHQHAKTSNCYVAHRCACDDCYSEQAKRARQWTRDRFYGRSEPSLVPSRGVQRRVQALHAAGWSFSELDRRFGSTRSYVRRLLLQKWVTPAVEARVRTLFSSLALATPPASTQQERRAATLARQHSAANGWLPPLAWDDIDLDDEPPTTEDADEVIDDVAVQRAMTGERIALTPAERCEAVRQLNAFGYADGAIAARLHVDVRSVVRIRSLADIPAARTAGRDLAVA